MAAQRLVATRQILLCVTIEVAEGGGQAVAAMLQGGAAERPQRILHSLGQRHEAFPPSTTWACSSRGTTSLSQTTASGSGRRRPRGAFLCDGSRGSCSMR